MLYKNEYLLPINAFKRDPLGRITYEGGSSAPDMPAPYDITTDKQYKEAAEFLHKLAPQMKANNLKMTPDQIIAALSDAQRNIIAQQSNPSAVPNMSSWGNIGAGVAPTSSSTTIIPQVAPQPSSNWTGGGVSPELMSSIQSLLAQGNVLGGKK